MFTGNKISISQLSEIDGLEIVRECYFSYCGKIGTELPNSLVWLEDSKYLEHLLGQTNIAGVVCSPNLANQIDNRIGLAIAPKPRQILNKIQDKISQIKGFQWQEFPAIISQTSVIHPSAIISPTDVIIEDDVEIGPGTVIYPRTVIEKGCRIGANTTIGCESFENNNVNGLQQRFCQSGGVLIKQNASVFSNACIVRATYGGFTTIGRNTMIDNLVHIAHDVQVCDNVKIIACAEISGRVHIGANSTIGMNATILNGINIGENSNVSLGAVVTKDVANNTRVSGNFAIQHNKFLQNLKELLTKNN